MTKYCGRCQFPQVKCLCFRGMIDFVNALRGVLRKAPLTKQGRKPTKYVRLPPERL